MPGFLILGYKCPAFMWFEIFTEQLKYANKNTLNGKALKEKGEIFIKSKSHWMTWDFFCNY